MDPEPASFASKPLLILEVQFVQTPAKLAETSSSFKFKHSLPEPAILVLILSVRIGSSEQTLPEPANANI